jgi:Trk K+ transport system NAD-binding subunit
VRKQETLITELNANYIFENGDHMLVFGNTERILKFTNKFA